MKEQLKAKSTMMELDEDGFLRYPETWTREVSQILAQQEILGNLSEAHWEVIDCLRQYYFEYGTLPPIKMLMRTTGFSIENIYDLFPHGFAKGVCKVAGIPKYAAMVQGYAGA